MLVTLGPVLVTTQGYSTPEVGELYERALLLSRRLGENEHVFPVLSGAWVFHAVRGQLEVSRELAQQCLDLANHEGVPTLSVMGHFLLGSCNFHLGRLEGSKTHLDQALAAFSGGSHPALALFAGPDVGVFCRSYQSHVLWHLGNAEEAARKSEEALAAARQVSHPFSMAIALDYAAMLHVFQRESERALARAEEAVAVCRKHGFTYYLSMAEILAGWAMAMAGDAETGVGAASRQGWRLSGRRERNCACRSTMACWPKPAPARGNWAKPWRISPMGLRSRARMARCGRRRTCTVFTATCCCSTGNPLQAQASYQRSLDTARLAGARMFELRAAACLHELENADSPRV